MKAKSIVMSGMILVSAGAHAQSSVTLFGMLDEGLNFTSNAGGKRAWQTSSVDVATSRWGIKGNEDLGGGLQALFDLESGFVMDNGQTYYGTRLFGYQAYVGLQSDALGTLTFGRQFDTVTDAIGLLTANGSWAGYLFSHPFDNDNTDATFHASNAVKFTSNTYGGFSGTALYGFSNEAGGFAHNRVYGVGLKYSYKTFSAGAVFEALSAPGSTAAGSVAPDDAGFTAADQKIYGIGASYGIGPATVGVVYTHTNIGKPAASIYVGDLGANLASLRFDNVEFNVRYDVRPDFFVGAMYTYTVAHLDHDGGTASLHWNQAGLMANYLLSKRTSVYAQAVYQDVSGGTTGTPLDGADIPGSAGSSSNGHQIVGRVGMSHAF